MCYHDHSGNGQLENTPSMQVIHLNNFLAVKCFSCAYKARTVAKDTDVEFSFGEDEIYNSRNRGLYIENVQNEYDEALLELPPDAPIPPLPEMICPRGLNWNRLIEKFVESNGASQVCVIQAPKGSGKTQELKK